MCTSPPTTAWSATSCGARTAPPRAPRWSRTSTSATPSSNGNPRQLTVVGNPHVPHRQHPGHPARHLHDRSGRHAAGDDGHRRPGRDAGDGRHADGRRRRQGAVESLRRLHLQRSMRSARPGPSSAEITSGGNNVDERRGRHRGRLGLLRADHREQQRHRAVAHERHDGGEGQGDRRGRQRQRAPRLHRDGQPRLLHRG